MDGDGDVDLMTANINTSDSMRLYRNDGFGNFSLDATLGITGFLAFRPRLLDLDGDGDLDLYTGNQVSNRVYLNDGTGAFSDTGQLLGTGVITQDIAFSDIDGDGDIDVFEASVNGDPNRPWFNNGSGLFSAGTSLGTERSRAAALADFDGDGDLDLVEGRVTGTFIWLNDGAGNFSGETQLSNSDVDAVALADMDGDGDLDLVEGNYSGGDRLLLNDGAGNFTDCGQDLGSDATHGLVVGDVDGDGDLDVATANYLGPNRVWINRAPQVQLNVSSSSGSEAAGSVITVTATAEGAVNGDQSVDLTVSGAGITASDYVLGSTQLTITNGMTGASTSFTVLDDALNEGDEIAQVSISAVSSGLIVGTPDSQTITIVDDDPLPIISGLSFSTGSFAETDGAISVNLSLSRVSAFDQCYKVSFTGDATLNSDYSVSDDDAAAGIQACASAGSTQRAAHPHANRRCGVRR